MACLLNTLARLAAPDKAVALMLVAGWAAGPGALHAQTQAIGAPLSIEEQKTYSSYQQGLRAYLAEDYTQARQYWMMGAFEGLSEAQFNLGVMYVEGRGAPYSAEQAVFWFQQAAERGHPAAQYNLGHLYADGVGISADSGAALKWWARAADQGYAQAQYSLGRAYLFGEQIQQDIPKARHWLEQAAKGGQADAAMLLAPNLAQFARLRVREQVPTVASLGKPDPAGARYVHTRVPETPLFVSDQGQNVKAHLVADQRLKVLASRGGRYLVVTADDARGWVSIGDVRVSSP